VAAATSAEITVRTSEPPKLRVRARVRELLSVRLILANLVRKDVTVKYKSSLLGAAWSMLNPILYLAVFSLVFTLILQNDIPHFPVYLLSGLLAWNLFAGSLGLAVRSVVDNANLVTKVYFPREILPLASIGASFVDFALQGLVLVLFMVAFRYNAFGLNLLLLPLSLVALLTFTAALAMFVAAVNVRYRDMQHLLTISLLAWFWLTPVVYPSALVERIGMQHQLFGVSLYHLFLLNPVADIVFGFQRALYAHPTVLVTRPNPHVAHVLLPVSVGWLALLLAAVIAGSLVLLYLSWRTFFRMSGDFAEEL
jgi:ABC-2 type transport system permease protein